MPETEDRGCTYGQLLSQRVDSANKYFKELFNKDLQAHKSKITDLEAFEHNYTNAYKPEQDKLIGEANSMAEQSKEISINSNKKVDKLWVGIALLVVASFAGSYFSAHTDTTTQNTNQYETVKKLNTLITLLETQIKNKTR